MRFFLPCSNGIGCFSPDGLTVALVSSDGSKKVQSFASKNKIIALNWFFLRGLQYLFCGLFAILRLFQTSFVMSNFEQSAFAKAISKHLYISARYLFVLTSIICSILATLLLLGYVPAKLSFLIVGASANFGLRNFVIAVLRVATIYLVLLALRFLPSCQTFYRFNYVCGQLNSQQNSTKSAKNAQKAAQNQPNFVNYLTFTFLFCVFVLSLVATNLSPWLALLANIATVLLVAGASYELMLLSKYKFFARLGVVVSWFVAVKPKVTQEEIAKVIKMESGYKFDSSLQEGVPLSAVVCEMQTLLQQQGRYEKSDVEWIVATVLNKNRAEAKLVRSISQKDYQQIMAITRRRAKGEPLSSIFGFVDFYGVRLSVNKKVLSPRVETELLVDEALKVIKAQGFKNVCDMCTGSGAIAIAIAKNADVKVCAVDVSKPALALAAENAKKADVKVEFVESDLFKHLKKFRKFDIIVSNPPYIESQQIANLQDEVKKQDPILALDGGEDGLDFYREITLQSKKRLCQGGVLMFELGIGQAASVKKIMRQQGYSEIKIVKDYEKRERIIYGKAN